MESLMSAFRHLTIPHSGNNHQAKLRQPTGLFGLLIIAIVAQLWIEVFTITQPTVLGYAISITVDGILAHTNEQRRNQGLSELRLDTQLSQAAVTKAQDMFEHDYWAHVTPAGQQPWGFITKAGYQYLYAGENLARDFMESQSVVSAWMDSPSHRDNLLSKNYDDIGIAIVNGNLAGAETTLVVQMFGARRIATQQPTINDTAQETAKHPLAALPSPVVLAQQSLPVESVPESKSPPPVQAIAETQNGSTSPTTSLASLPLTSPFIAHQVISLAIALLLAGVLLLDEMVMSYKRLGRIAGRTWAHFLFVVSTIGMLILAKPGLII